jgi:hypothetical protein
LVFSLVIPAAVACHPAPPQHAAGAASASASAGPAIDPSRTDFALLKALSAVRDRGEVSDALDPTTKQALQKVEGALEPQERARAARGDKAIVSSHPLLAIDLGSDDQEALFAIAARGMASREILFLRSYAAGNKPLTELTGVESLGPVTREVSKRAAAKLAKILFDQARSSVRPIGSAEADRIEALARILGDTTLQRAAIDHSVKVEASPRYHAWAAVVSARFLEIDAARSHIAAAGSATDEPTRLAVDRARATLERAEAVHRARSAKSTGDAALDAATAALRLERFDLAKELLAQSGVAPDADLRASVVQAIVMLDGSLCDGNDISGEHIVLCAALWDHNPNVAKALDTLRRGLGSARGRDAWSLEAYAGLVHVMPMIYRLAGGGVKSESEGKAFFRRLFQEPRDVLVPGETLPKIRRDSFALFADAVTAAYAEIEKNGTGTLRIAPELRADLRRRAEALVSSGSNDPWVSRAVVASMVVIASQEDPTSVLSRLVVTSDLSTSLGTVLATSAVRYQHPDALQRARDLLHAKQPGEAPQARWRADTLADEARVALVGDTRSNESLLSTINIEIPADAGVAERFQYAIDLMGLAARAGQQLEAEQIVEQVNAQLINAPESSDTRELRDAIESAIDGVTARSISADRRQVALKRIESRLEKRTPTSAPEAMYYSAIFWRALIDRDERARCKTTDRACVDAITEKIKKVDGIMAELAAAMNPSTLELVKKGTFPLGGGAQFGINYSLEYGISPTLELTARMLILPPPALTPIVESAKTPGAKPLPTKPGATKPPATK